MEWLGEKEGVVHYCRPGGWEILMNVSCPAGVQVPKGEVLLSSGKLEGDIIPVNTTVWIKEC